ncbi:unnamed protein product [Parascedosporium putredinis]|uniref:18S rRNA factor 2 n=1 Tax=Parascedosporium putredinis TaxID=1442378 RepID=A0A9P1M978_9PEZI|nr:unnamed protein product [Parascedosporium putredinis]CAI7991524.1 unnamed protein product [Parascedosporium putredinis]
MAPEKRNNFLDADDSDSDAQSQGYDSDREVRKGARTAKRRKIDNTRAGSDGDDYSSDEGSGSDHGVRLSKTKAKGPVAPAAVKVPKLINTADPLRSLIKRNLVSSEDAIKKSGVLYVSRVPPFMKPHKLRTLLEPFGTINRTYLAPEDPASHQRRVRAGGNKKKLFTEGWIEFVDKRDAKKAHQLLNARTIGGKKGSYYRDDVWSLVYLKGFKWRDLTAQIEKENAERESRMRAEISKAARENLEFVRNVEQAKQLDGIKAKKEKKDKRVAKGNSAGQAPSRTFKQVPQVSKRKPGEVGEEPAENVKRVLSKIF